MSEQQPTALEKFEAAIDLAITLVMDCGLHPVEMVELLELKAEELGRQ